MPMTSRYDDITGDTMTSAPQDATYNVFLTSSTASNGTRLTSHLLQRLTSLKTTDEDDDDDAFDDFLTRQQVNWYMVIAILSALVLVGMFFTICRLVMKASAHERAGQGWHRDSLLYSRKDSIIPISLHFDQADDSNNPCS